jgi:predicted small lipoprotein YifL
MKAVMQTLFVMALASLCLTGCGQKGDLSLPKTPPPIATPADLPVEPALQQQSQPTATDVKKAHSETNLPEQQSAEQSTNSTQPAVLQHSGSAQQNATQR